MPTARTPSAEPSVTDQVRQIQRFHPKPHARYKRHGREQDVVRRNERGRTWVERSFVSDAQGAAHAYEESMFWDQAARQIADAIDTQNSNMELSYSI